MKSLTPMFSMAAVYKYIDKFADDRIRKLVDTLAYIGEQTVNNARLVGEYTDRTGNLRASTGYTIILHGETKKHSSGGQAAGPVSEFIDWAKREFSQGLVLVVFAGMEYAAAVESRGYDVISNSIPLAQELQKEFKVESLDNFSDFLREL